VELSLQNLGCFLGLGINPPQMSWGSLLSSGKSVLDIAL